MRKNYTISIPVQTFWTIVVPLTVLLMSAGSLTAILVIDRAVMPKIVSVDKGLVEVPDIINLEWEEARQKLFDKGLRAQVTGKEYNDEIEQNHVIKQEPKAGEKVNTTERRGVHITMSRGAEVLSVPDVTRIMERKAKRELRKKGFSIGNVNKSFSNKIPKDNVIALFPAPGTEISRELPVNMTISKGPKPTHAEVPNVIGDLLSSAKSKISEAGLKVGKVKSKNSATSRPGTIISQSVAPGSNVPFESAVNLVVSTKGKF